MRAHTLAAGALIAAALVTAAQADMVLSWTWTPSPTSDADGHPLAPAAYYEVFVTIDDAHESFAGTTEEPAWRLEAASGSTYRLRVRAVTAQGWRSEMSPYSLPETVAAPTSVPAQPAAGLDHAFPNPFNPRTTIVYTVPATGAGTAELAVVDLRGRHVRSLAIDPSPGRHEAVWDGTDATGARVASGVYFVRFRHGDREASLKVTLTG